MRLKSKCNGCHRKLEIEGDAGVNAVVCPSCGGTVRLPQTILEQGETLGDFKVIRHIGSGSMGDVYLATQVSMEREVAIKVLPPDIKEDQESLDTFLAEVRTLAKLDHPNIVTAFQAGEADGLYFLAMTYVNGGSLEDRLEAKGPLPEADALHICLRVAQALRYAWDRYQIIHRDIKPENIMMDTLQDQPKILDLGISKMIGDDSRLQSETGLLIGTPHFMSPEQAEAKGSIDYRSDMYSLGCTLFRLVTGKVPYDGNDPMKVLIRHIHEPIPDPYDHRPDLHPATRDLIAQLMAKNPDERFDDWTDLVDYIKEILDAVKSPDTELDTNTHPMPRRRIRKVEDGILPSAGRFDSDESASEQQDQPQSKLPIGLLAVIAFILVVSLLAVVGLEIFKRMRSVQEQDPSSPSPVLETRPLESSNDTNPDTVQTVTSLDHKTPSGGKEAETIDARVQAALAQTARTPGQVAAAIRTIEGLVQETGRSPHAAKLNARLKELQADQVFMRLKAEALKLCKQDQAGQGRRLIITYAGPFAKETEQKREKLLRELREKYPPKKRRRR